MTGANGPKQSFEIGLANNSDADLAAVRRKQVLVTM